MWFSLARDPARRFRLLGVAAWCLAALADVDAPAQESLDTIRERGYVGEWLVCGPFMSSVDGGIVEGLKRGEAPLGRKDHLAPIGRVSRARPQEGTRVAAVDGERRWERRRVTDASVDLSDLFHGRHEGVAYAAFSCMSMTRDTAYVDLQTPLGARVWVNGFPISDSKAAPLESLGADRFLASFRSGENRVMVAIPMATLDGLADATGIAAERLRARGFPNRPLLSGSTGFEFALRLLPAQSLGDLIFVPRLRSTGSFTDHAGEVRQEAVLTVYNPKEEDSLPITVRIESGGPLQVVEQVVSSIPPGAQKEAALSIPTGDAIPGQSLSIRVSLTTRETKAVFTGSLTVGAPPSEGTVYLVTGGFFEPGLPEDQRTEVQRRFEEFDRHLALASTEPDYGFFLGSVPYWKPYLDVRPENRQALLHLVDQLRCSPRAGYGILDERIVNGEVLVRNLAYGQVVALALLKRPGKCYFAWDAPGLCPQSAQLAAKAGLLGTVSDLPLPGVPGLFRHVALDRTEALHRRKRPSPGPRSLDVLTEMADVQRRELLERGWKSDLLVNASTSPPPEPFFLGACAALKQGLPSIRVTGLGGDEFLRRTLDESARGVQRIPSTGRLLTGYQPGALLAQPELKYAYRKTESLLLIAERFATMAALHGAEFPEAALDTAWRQLLNCGAPDRLGFAPTPRIFLDTLASCREAAGLADEVLHGSLSYLADHVDTESRAPGRPRGVTPVLVFNPSSWQRTDRCTASLGLEYAAGLTLYDDKGNTVPYAAAPVGSGQGGPGTGLTVTFAAVDVPATGYRTFYAVQSGTLPASVAASDNVIENDVFRVTIDPAGGGTIASLVHKPSGREFASRAMNDVVAMVEDPLHTNGGRELWTTPRLTKASANPAQVTISRSKAMQHATITVPFLDGALVRELTLFQGVPELDCRVCFEGVTTRDTLFAVASGCFSIGNAPVYGERFGACVGRTSAQLFDFRTAAGDNPSGAATQIAMRWAALSPNDYLMFSHDIAVPLLPAAVIYGTDDAFVPAAEELLAAFVSRGIPCAAYSEQGPEKDPIWSDSSEFEDIQEDLRHGAGMRIVLGTGDHTAICRRLCATLTEDAREDFNRRAGGGTMLFLYDESGGIPPVPTLILAGHSAETVFALARSVAESLKVQGFVQVPKGAYVPSTGLPLGGGGVAILHEGASVHSMTGNGDMIFALFHGSAWDRTEPPLDVPTDSNNGFHYAFLPFLGDWRGAGVVRAAHAFGEPFTAVTTDRRLGTLPDSRSFLETTAPGFVVTAIKPMGYASAGRRGASPTPRGGITVRGYETDGQRWQGAVRFFARLRRVERRNLQESSGQDLGPSGHEVYPRTGPFGIETMTFLPATGIPMLSEATTLAPDSDPYSPAYARYWRHNRGAAPLGFQPLSVLIGGDLRDGGTAIAVTVSNNRVAGPIEGTVRLTATTGWEITPEQFSYYVRPGESTTREVVVLGSLEAGGSGGVVAETLYAGRTYRDVLELRPQNLELAIVQDEGEVAITARNPSTIAAVGFAELIVPPQYWAELPGPRAGSVTPRRAALRIPPLEEQRVLFRYTGERPPWMTVKLAANGHVLYRNVPNSI